MILYINISYKDFRSLIVPRTYIPTQLTLMIAVYTLLQATPDAAPWPLYPRIQKMLGLGVVVIMLFLCDSALGDALFYEANPESASYLWLGGYRCQSIC